MNINNLQSPTYSKYSHIKSTKLLATCKHMYMIKLAVDYQEIPSEIPYIITTTSYHCALQIEDDDIILQSLFIARKVLLACYIKES